MLNTEVGFNKYSVYKFLVEVFSALLLLIVCSKIKLYFFEVPYTMQTVAVMLIGYLFSKSIILSVFASYFSLGLFGLPVFADNMVGLLIFSPTFGYLIGFVLSAFFINSYKDSIPQKFLLFTLAHLIILISGVAVLSILIGDMYHAVKVGFLPFIISDLVKINLSYVICKYLQKSA